MDDAPADSAPVLNPNIAELAKSGRSACKKCKALIEKDSLRLGKAYDNGDRVMTSWYHCACWPVPKKLGCVAEIGGWDELSDAHKQQVIDRCGPSKAPANAPAATGPSASSPACAMALAQGSLTSFVGGRKAPVSAGAPARPAPVLDSSGGAFAEFVELCDRVTAVGSTLTKTELISTHLAALVKRKIDPYLTVRLLLPSKSGNDLRVYSVKDKSLVSHVSTALRCSEAAMAAHLESSADFGATAEHFFALRLAQKHAGATAADTASMSPPPTSSLTLSDVNDWLDRFAMPDTAALVMLCELVPRCGTPAELRVAMRLVSKDLRIGGGTAIVLKGVGGDRAYERFKAQPDGLRKLVSDTCDGAHGAGHGAGQGAGQGAGHGAGHGGSGAGHSGSGAVRLGEPFKPQLAGQCGAFDKAVTAFPRGFFVEVKYDGERLQAHLLRGGAVRFFARSLKETTETKVTGLAAAVVAAFPNASEVTARLQRTRAAAASISCAIG